MLPRDSTPSAIPLGMIRIEGKTDADAKAGWVYVLHDSALPQQVKVGRTVRTVRGRARELATGRATPLVEVWAEYVSNTELVEGLVHQQLDAYRMGKTEFFSLPPQVAIHVLQVEARPFLLNDSRLKALKYDMLPELIVKYGRGVISHDARSLEMLRNSKGIFVETRLSAGSTGATMTSQRHLAAVDPLVDGLSMPEGVSEDTFSTEQTAEENAATFLGLDLLTQAYFSDVFDMDYVARQQAP